jgi:opacity protein-like surface antigen
MKKTLLALALIGASATASADSWIYGSASVGQADVGGETASSYNVYFAAKPSIDFGPLHVYAKAGLHSYKLEDSSAGFEEDEIDMMYGIGAEYFMAGPISIGASYNVFSLKEDDVKNFSINATFHFL